jgi:TolB protein
VSYKAGNPRVYTHGLNTGTRKMLTPFAGSNISPAISPDGSKIAMILSKDGNPELYVGFADGTGLRRLTRTREDESSPCWSPDGRTILFVSRASGKPSLYTVPVAGGTMKRVRTYGVPNATEPDWSPDGKWIIFTTLMGSFQLCLVPAEGGNAETLCAGEDATWAANSRAVIFCRGQDRGKRLFLLDVPTKQVKDVPRILMSNSQPSWDR